MRRLREAELFPAVKAWLERRAYTAYAEVPWPLASASTIDVVGVRWADADVVIVEMKTAFTRHLHDQCNLAQLITDDVWAAVGTKPRTASRLAAMKSGIGLLRVCDGQCEMLISSNGRPARKALGRGDKILNHYQQRLLDNLRRCGEAHQLAVAGVPNLRGTGPAQLVYEAVAAYKATHPTARWREIFAAVPNHYVDHNSLCGAMRTVGRIRAWRARREAQK